jgi:hypothetical protein
MSTFFVDAYKSMERWVDPPNDGDEQQNLAADNCFANSSRESLAERKIRSLFMTGAGVV